jgi:predicted esterase
MKIVTAVVLSPLIIIPLAIFSSLKTELDINMFPFQKRFRPKMQDNIQAPAGGKSVQVTANKNTLIGYDYPHKDTSTPCKGIIVYLPGNDQSAEAAAHDHAEKWQENGFRSLFVSYPGHGLSDGKILSEQDAYAAGQAFIEHALTLPRDKDCPIILMGASVGSGIAMHLAAENPKSVDKVILHAPYFSTESLTKERIGLGASLIKPINYHIPTAKDLVRFTQTSPDKKVLIMHAQDDDTIPYTQSKEIVSHYMKSKLANPRQVSLVKFIPPDDHRSTDCDVTYCKEGHLHYKDFWHSYLPDEFNKELFLDNKWPWNKET